MNGWSILIASAFLALSVVPFGMLPGILFFRDVANGTDAGSFRKTLYTASIWCGLATTWLAATAAIFGLIEVLAR